MDKVTRYKNIVREVIEGVADFLQNPKDPIKVVLIKDEESGNYLLFNDGWYENESRIYGCFLHVHVAADGKVWFQYDGTDMEVGKTLMEKGIPAKDMVVGFHSPSVRPDTEFAVG